jgi:hypothetical protein
VSDLLSINEAQLTLDGEMALKISQLHASSVIVDLASSRMFLAANFGRETRQVSSYGAFGLGRQARFP